MLPKLDFYEERIEDIQIYLEYLSSLSKAKNKELRVKSILIANGYLLIYNLVEATIKNICEQIHSAIKKEKVPYQKLSEQLQSIYWDFLHERYNFKDSKNFKERLLKISQNLVLGKEAFIDEFAPLKGKSVGHEQVEEISKLYGLNFEFDKKNKSEKNQLDLIKDKRLRLAHGQDSFSSLGSEFSVRDLEETFKKVEAALEKLIDSVESFIKHKQYSNQPVTS